MLKKCHIQGEKTVSILLIPHIYSDLAPHLSEKIRYWLTPLPPLSEKIRNWLTSTPSVTSPPSVAPNNKTLQFQQNTSISRPGGCEVYGLAKNMPTSQKSRKLL